MCLPKYSREILVHVHESYFTTVTNHLLSYKKKKLLQLSGHKTIKSSSAGATVPNALLYETFSIIIFEKIDLKQLAGSDGELIGNHITLID